MTPTLATEMLRDLEQHERDFDDLLARCRAGGSEWSSEQLRLWLSHQPALQYNEGADCFKSGHENQEGDLNQALTEAVRSFAGRPATAAQVRERLPGHFVTTNEQILALARKIDALDVFGPGLLRLTPSSN